MDLKSKKRPASSQLSQPSRDVKKRHLEAEKPKKKAVPVTSTPNEAQSSDEESQISDEDMQDNEQEVIPSIAKPGTGAGYESHKLQKEMLSQRKASKPNAAIMDQAKRIWASARQRDLPKTERDKMCKQLADLIRGKVVDVVFKHDASRIIQTLVKYGKKDERDMVALELKGRYQELAQNKYSKFLVLKLIRHCPTHRSSILSEFHGHVLRLLLHREAGQVISESFELYATPVDKARLLREFYGKEVILFESEKNIRSGLHGVLEGLDEDRKNRILGALKENIQKIFENSEKGAVSNAIFHCALWEYLSELELMQNQVEAEKIRREMLELCQDVIAEIIHTKNGSLTARYFIAYGTAKDRKQIVKNLKPHLERICLDSEAQLVLFTLLDVTDDTKLLSKSLLSDLAALAPKLYMDANGRRALLYPLIGRNKRHMTPVIVEALKSTDAIREKTSKKDEAVRREEVRKAVSEDMLKQIRNHAEKMIMDPGGSLLVTEVLLHADGDETSAIEAVLRPLATSYPGKGSKHPVEHAHTSRLFKTLFQGGHWSQSTSSIERSQTFNAASFASAFLRIVGDDDGERIVSMAKSDGAFVVAELCERVVLEGSESDRQKLKVWFNDSVMEDLERLEVRGMGVLLEKLKALKGNASPQQSNGRKKRAK